jgi:transglutaminase-like putative cysteine protease
VLQPTAFLDEDSPAVRAFAERHAGQGEPRERAVRLYYAVRDTIRYDMTTFGLHPNQFKASEVLQAPKGCAEGDRAVARAAGIPARIGFADVCNRGNDGVDRHGEVHNAASDKLQHG